MSLRRGGKGSKEYRDSQNGYIYSPAWRARRRKFLKDNNMIKGLECACCLEELTDRTADVHHLSYEHMGKKPDGRWFANEPDEDLMVMCRWCHDRLHKLLDHDRGWSNKDRRQASLAVVERIQLRLLREGLKYIQNNQADKGGDW